MADLKTHSRAARLLFPVMGIAWGAMSYFFMQWNVIPYGVMLALVLACVFAIDFITVRQQMKPKKTAAVHAAVLTAAVGLIYFVASYLVNNVLLRAVHAEWTVLLLLGLFLLLLCVLYVRWKKSYAGLTGKKPAPWGAVLAVLATVLVTVLPTFFLRILPQLYQYYEVREPAPAVYGSYTEKEAATVTDADFYVAVDGNDANDGSFARPFATPEKALFDKLVSDRRFNGSDPESYLLDDLRLDEDSLRRLKRKRLGELAPFMTGRLKSVYDYLESLQ